LSGNNNIYNEANYFASNIPIFLKNAEIVCSVDKYQLPSVALERFLGRKGAENINKVRFAPKFSSICVN